MLVALKATLHLRKGVACLIGDQASMTGNALSAYAGHGQVSVVIEHNGGSLLCLSRARRVQTRLHLFVVLGVAPQAISIARVGNLAGGALHVDVTT